MKVLNASKFWRLRINSPLCLLFLAGCAQTQLESPTESEQKAALQQEAKDAKNSFAGLSGATLKNSKLEGNDAKGRPLWRLEAKEIRAQSGLNGGSPKTATLMGAKATLFENGQAQSTLTAPLIRLFNTQNGARLNFPKGVRAQSAAAFGGKKVELTAPRGDVDVAKKLVVLSGGATAKQGDFTVKGQILRAFTDLAKAQMSGGVTAQSATGKVSAQTASYDWKAGRVSAKTVALTRGDTILRGETLDGDTQNQRGILRQNVRAKSPNGTASAPFLSFDFGRDRIETRDVNFSNSEGKGRAAKLESDSKLRVSTAGGLILEKDGATLRAASASGFDGLSRLRGQDIEITRAGEKISAARADAQNWNTPRAKITASGGVRVTNSRGVATAPSATLQNEKIVASGGLEIQSQGQILRASSGQSDLEFQNATLRGNVRANLAQGGSLQAPLVEKRGEKVVASGGANGVFPSNTTYGPLSFSAKRLETSISGEQIVASGGVQIKAQNGARATASNAIYNRKTGKITATGGVFFSDPARGFTQRGSSLVADLKRREVVVQNPQGQGNASGQDLF